MRAWESDAGTKRGELKCEREAPQSLVSKLKTPQEGEAGRALRRSPRGPFRGKNLLLGGAQHHLRAAIQVDVSRIRGNHAALSRAVRSRRKLQSLKPEHA